MTDLMGVGRGDADHADEDVLGQKWQHVLSSHRCCDYDDLKMCNCMSFSKGSAFSERKRNAVP